MKALSMGNLTKHSICTLYFGHTEFDSSTPNYQLVGYYHRFLLHQVV
ncbi:hypothetical protein SOVF_075140 [Spinacia oleracea]|nr:hypothetical protein SOVF_075140 [Spinacia oleracea]